MNRRPFATPLTGRSARTLALLAVVAVVVIAVLVAPLGLRPFTSATPAVEPILVGAVFPTDSNAAALAGPELEGVRIAARLVNADGGLAGRPIQLVERSLPSRDAAPGVMAGLQQHGVKVVIGAYSSDL